MTNPTTLELPDLILLKDYAHNFSLRQSPKMTFTGFGSAKSPFKSRGLNFAEVRQYQAGDDIRQIDWRVTAKYGKPYTKLYTEEKERQIHIICDLRSNMHFASHGHFKSVVAGRLSALSAFLAEKENYNISYQILTNKVINSPHDTTSNVLIPVFLNTLIQQQNHSENISFDQVVTPLAQIIRPGASILIFSDLSDISDTTLQFFGKLSTKNQIYFIHIYDEMETQLPRGILPFSNGKDTTVLDTTHKSFQQRFESSWLNQTQKLQEKMVKWDMNYFAITTNQPYIQKFLSYCQGE